MRPLRFHLAAIGSWLRRGRHPVEPVEVTPVQQLALRSLGRFGPLPYARLAAEIEAVRAATPADIVNGLLKLEAAGVIERMAETGVRQPDRRYQLTPRGRRILRYLPADPRAVLEFQV